MTDGLLNGLDGIEEARDVQRREKTTLDIMLKVGKETVEKYYQSMPNIQGTDGLNMMDQFYSTVYHDVEERLKEIAYNEHEISAFVLTKANSDEAYTLENEHKAQILGVYTSCIAQLLTEKNKAKGKRTCIYVNGKESKFDYLFWFAREVDTLVIENFNGNEICSYLGSFNGHAERVIARNLNGNKILNFTAYNHGNIKQVLGINMTGCNDIFSSICGNGGYAEQVVGVNLKTQFQVMRGIGFDNGKINQLIAKEISGLEALTGLASNGGINQVIFDGISSPFAFCQCACYNGKINMMVGGLIEEKPSGSIFRNCGHDIGLLAYSTLNPPQYFDPKKVVSATSAEKLVSIWRRVNFSDIMFLVDDLQTWPYPRLLEIADQLYALRPAVPDGFFERK